MQRKEFSATLQCFKTLVSNGLFLFSRWALDHNFLDIIISLLYFFEMPSCNFLIFQLWKRCKANDSLCLARWTQPSPGFGRLHDCPIKLWVSPVLVPMRQTKIDLFILVIHSKSEKVCGTAFSVKKNCGKSSGYFWAIFLVILGPFWVIFGPLWAILGSFLAISWHFWTNLRKVQIFLWPRLELRDLLLECMMMMTWLRRWWWEII